MSRNKTRVLVLGATGMLGHMVMNVLQQDKSFLVDGTYLEGAEKRFLFDILQGPSRLDQICKRNGPYQYVINCIGITKNRINERDYASVEWAIKVNTLFPHELCRVAEKHNIKVMQISTDGVFGDHAGVCTEDTVPDAHDVYGLSKYLGEVKADNFLNIRSSIIGPSPFEKGGLYEWLLSRRNGMEVPGFVNHLWSGATTLQFALLCKMIMKESVFDSMRAEACVYHFAPNRPVSKLVLLRLLQKHSGKNVSVVPVRNSNRGITRVLKTKFPVMKQLFPHNTTVSEAVSQLMEFK